MKKLALPLALCAAVISAQAGTMFSIPNNAGGEIRLTDDTGPCRANTRHAYSTSSTGEATFGCWTGGPDATFLLSWDNGRKSVFEWKDVTVTDYGRRQLKTGLKPTGR
jgi:hypothetical protein